MIRHVPSRWPRHSCKPRASGDDPEDLVIEAQNTTVDPARAGERPVCLRWRDRSMSPGRLDRCPPGPHQAGGRLRGRLSLADPAAKEPTATVEKIAETPESCSNTPVD